MRKKISFQSAKETLLENNLLVESSSASLPAHEGWLQTRSDACQRSDLFLAIQGMQIDAHDLLESAIERGAGLVIVENKNKLDRILGLTSISNIHWLLVSSCREAWTVLSALSYENPQKKIRFFGVTGTDGKTSTVWIASQIVRKSEAQCMSVGTLGIYDGQEYWPINHTTPDPPVFFSKLEHCVTKKIPNVLMEVSSHSLVQKKLANLSFSAAVWTSFSREHLDFHKNMEDYWQAKCILFEQLLAPQGRIILNHRLIHKFSVDALKSPNSWTYGFDPERKVQHPNHVALLECRPTSQGQYIRFLVRDEIIEGCIPYVGLHNAENFVAAWLLAESVLGRRPSSDLWSKLDPIPGRCERIGSKERAPKVYVDFAHTPQALRTILSTLREYTQGKLWVVFGCGGDRDQGKRPEMAAAAEALADKLIMSSDNPRTEDPLLILEQMKAGLQDPSQVILEVDRRKAIGIAIANADVDDLILIAGKGHESQQIIGTKTFPFSDQETALHFLTELWS